MNFDFVVKIVVKYLENHPEVVEKLMEKAVEALLAYLASKQ